MSSHWQVPGERAGQRLDKTLAELAGFSRGQVTQYLTDGRVQLNGEVVHKPSQAVDAGDRLSVSLPDAPAAPELTVMYEDDDTIVIDKPAGLLVHATAAYEREPTVATFAAAHTSDPDPLRPGIVHRLDRNTSGLLLIAKSAGAKAYYQQQFAKRLVQKTYLALVEGHVREPEATIDVPLGRSPKHPLRRVADPSGKPALTIYDVQTRYVRFDLVEARPRTGRTHQLRAHFAYLGHPIVGDALYGSAHELPGKRYWLHAAELRFTAFNGSPVTAQSPLPAVLTAHLGTLTPEGAA